MLVQPRSRNERRSWQCRIDRRIGTSHIRTVGQIPELEISSDKLVTQERLTDQLVQSRVVGSLGSMRIVGLYVSCVDALGIPEGKAPALVSLLQNSSMIRTYRKTLLGTGGAAIIRFAYYEALGAEHTRRSGVAILQSRS